MRPSLSQCGGYPVGIGPGWLATNQMAISPIANTTTINTPVRVHMRQPTIHARATALRLHNFSLLSGALGAYLGSAGRRWVRPRGCVRPPRIAASHSADDRYRCLVR